jgi:hypothetical protein
MADGQRRRSLGEGDRQFVPTRLLDVGRAPDDKLRVVDGCEQQNIRGPYATLSHKWGRVNPEARFQLSYATKDLLFNGFEMEDFPREARTFREATEVTRTLGIRYLWIDSICINQADRDDWLREGALMEKIYTNSYCNLAAVDSEDGSFGLFRGPRDPEQLAPDIVEYRESKYALLRPDFWRHQLLDEPLYTRGWVLQGKCKLRKVVICIGLTLG